MKLRNWFSVLLMLVMIFLLCGCAQEGPYRVKVVDDAGNPMVGIGVQLCKDSCMMAVTDEQGIAAFDAQPDDYKVAFMRLPDGYSAEQEEFFFAKGSREMTIVLKKVQ